MLNNRLFPDQHLCHRVRQIRVIGIPDETLDDRYFTLIPDDKEIARMRHKWLTAAGAEIEEMNRLLEDSLVRNDNVRSVLHERSAERRERVLLDGSVFPETGRNTVDVLRQCFGEASHGNTGGQRTDGRECGG